MTTGKPPGGDGGQGPLHGPGKPIEPPPRDKGGIGNRIVPDDVPDCEPPEPASDEPASDEPETDSGGPELTGVQIDDLRALTRRVVLELAPQGGADAGGIEVLTQGIVLEVVQSHRGGHVLTDVKSLAERIARVRLGESAGGTLGDVGRAYDRVQPPSDAGGIANKKLV